MVEVDIEDGLHYPLRGDDALTVHAVGGGLPALVNLLWLVVVFAALFVEELLVLALALVPLVLVVGVAWLGYFLRVARSTLDGAADPPGLGDLGGLFADGLWGSLLSAVYWVPAVAVTGVGYVVVFAAMFGLESMSAGAGAAASELTTVGVGMVLMVLMMLVGFALSVAAAYLLPISLVAYADEGSVGAALSPARLKSVGLSAEYAVPWMLVAGAYFAVYVMVSFLSAVLIGYLLVPFLPLVYFFLGMAAFRVFARAYALEVGQADAAVAASGEGPPAGGRAAGGNRAPEDV